MEEEVRLEEAKVKAAEAEVKVVEAKIKDKVVEAEVEQDSMADSWKDEFIVVALMLPMVVTFVSAAIGGDTTSAWEAMKNAPEWYSSLLGIVILVVFGLKQVVIDGVRHVIRMREFEKGMSPGNAKINGKG